MTLYPALRRFASVVRPAEVDADDLLHEALARTLAAGPLDRLDDPGAYLRTAMLRVAANHRRRLGRGRRATLRAMAGQAVAEPPTVPSDLADLMLLPPKDRAVLYLFVVEGHSYAEIGRMLGWNEGTARTRASRARKKLRVEITKELEDDHD